MSGLLFVITAASGTGKTSLVKALLTDMSDIHLSVSHTTRTMRLGEEDGVHYHFTEKQDFIDKIGQGAFIEHAEVFGNFYGTSFKSLDDALKQGRDVLLEIDWQGAHQVRRFFPDSVQIFIMPPSVSALKERLTNRGQDSEDVIKQRLAGAIEEMRQYSTFDFLIINDVFDQALIDLKAIVCTQRLTVTQQSKNQHQLINNVLSQQS